MSADFHRETLPPPAFFAALLSEIVEQELFDEKSSLPRQ
jgi:hypothetical protein